MGPIPPGDLRTAFYNRTLGTRCEVILVLNVAVRIIFVSLATWLARLWPADSSRKGHELRGRSKERLTALLLMIPLLAPSLALPAVASDRDDVLSAETLVNAAVTRHDTASVAKLIAPDYTLVIGGGKVYDHASFLALVADRSITYTTNLASQQVVRFYGDSTAVVVGILDVRGQAGSSAFAYHLRYTDTWVKIANSWVEAAGHSSIYG